MNLSIILKTKIIQPFMRQIRTSRKKYVLLLFQNLVKNNFYVKIFLQISIEFMCKREIKREKKRKKERNREIFFLKIPHESFARTQLDGNDT